MITIGEGFQLKTTLEELREELTPSFDEVIRGWLGEPVRTKFKDPNYVLNVTHITEPLRILIERIASQLETYSIVGGPLERGFGFGKTHLLILLWHLFNSPIEREKLHNLGIKKELVRQTLVLGMDYSKYKPFMRLIEELKAYTNPNHPVTKLKDPLLIQSISEVLTQYSDKLASIGSKELAELIAKILTKYRDKGGTPRLLLLIDELGWGVANILREYASSGHEELYTEATRIEDFLAFLYGELHGEGIPAVVIWVMADQDRKDIEALAKKHADKETLARKLEGFIEGIDNIGERYRRGLGGTNLAELSYDPKHAIEIAKYRVLRSFADINELRRKYLEYLESFTKQLNLSEFFEREKEYLSNIYPFSLGLGKLLIKLMNPTDVPETEYIRTVIYVATEAAENALKSDPVDSYVIGVKHLSLAGVARRDLMGPLEADWLAALSDIEQGLQRIDPSKREVAELLAKYILAKGVTANISALLEASDKASLEKFGTTAEELQLEILMSYSPEEVSKLIDILGDALDQLRAETARIDEREAEEKRYYLPSLLRTVYDRLARFIVEERAELEKRELIPIYLTERGTIPQLFTGLKVHIAGRCGDIQVVMLDSQKVSNPDTLISDPSVSETQNKGRLALVLVPIWDISLFTELYIQKGSYDAVVEKIRSRLQSAVEQGKIRRPLHIVLFIPDLREPRLSKVLDELAIYEGTKKFIDYLSDKRKIIEERVREYETTLIKRKDLTYFFEEFEKRKKRELMSILERQINDARSLAQKQLISLSRRLTADVLELYSKVIYYSIDTSEFTVKDVRELTIKAQSRISSINVRSISEGLSQYADVVGEFLRMVVSSLGYVHDPTIIAQELKKSYEKEFEQGLLREYDRRDDVVENIMQGTYNLKPLSLTVADEAVKLLNGHEIELLDKRIIIHVDENAGLVKFQVEKKEAPTHVEETISELPTVEGIPESESISVGAKPLPVRPPTSDVDKISIELGTSPNIQDIVFRLQTLVNLDLVSNIKVTAPSERLKFELELKKPNQDDIRFLPAVLNFATQLAKKYEGKINTEIKLAKKVPMSEIKKILGDYVKERKSSLDRFFT